MPLKQMILGLIAGYDALVLVYFLVLNGTYIAMNFVSFVSVRSYVSEMQAVRYEEIFQSSFYQPISVLSPAYNEEATVVSAVQSLLQLKYPEFEVVVINDGSKDKTLELLIEAYKLKKIPRTYAKKIDFKPIRGIYSSKDFPELIVIDKENGGKADALNAGITVSKYPLFCTLDADSLLERDCLLKVSRPFIENPDVIAVGGIVRIANGCDIQHGEVMHIGVAKSGLVRFQIIEYLRAFLFGRVGWATINALLVISGAFGLYKKKTVLEAGGYDTHNVGEDMELVVRLHRHMRYTRQKYRIVFVPDPVCWTEAPEDFKTLGKQRSRWQQGLKEALMNSKQMLLNPRYGAVGLLAMPFFFFMEMLGPVIEFTGYFVFLASWYFGLVSPFYALMFLGAAILLGVVLSTGSLVLEEMTFRRYPRLRDVLILFAYSILENFGYRQLHAWWRMKGLINSLTGKHSWGEMERKGFASVK